MIRVDNLVKHYGPIQAVNGVSFEVNQGDILGFLGPNGAGKSTTMKMVTGFISPTSGTASINGHDILEAPIEAKKAIGYLPESAPVYNEMTVNEYLGFIAEVRGYRGRLRDAKIHRVIELCHLSSVQRQSIETLSKGYRQRVGFAQALLHDPSALILDEPTDGLDPNQKREVRKLIQDMASEKAIVLSTHILEEVEALCNRVIIIAQGEVLVDETPDALRNRNPMMHAVRIKVANVTTDNIQRLLAETAFVDSVELKDGMCVVFPGEKKSIETELLKFCQANNWDLTHFEKVPTRLETVFENLTM